VRLDLNHRRYHCLTPSKQHESARKSRIRQSLRIDPAAHRCILRARRGFLWRKEAADFQSAAPDGADGKSRDFRRVLRVTFHTLLWCLAAGVLAENLLLQKENREFRIAPRINRAPNRPVAVPPGSYDAAIRLARTSKTLFEK